MVFDIEVSQNKDLPKIFGFLLIRIDIRWSGGAPILRNHQIKETHIFQIYILKHITSASLAAEASEKRTWGEQNQTRLHNLISEQSQVNK